MQRMTAESSHTKEDLRRSWLPMLSAIRGSWSRTRRRPGAAQVPALPAFRSENGAVCRAFHPPRTPPLLHLRKPLRPSCDFRFGYPRAPSVAARFDFSQFRNSFHAGRHRPSTARREGTSGRHVREVGRRTGYGCQPTSFGTGMDRRIQQALKR